VNGVEDILGNIKEGQEQMKKVQELYKLHQEKISSMPKAQKVQKSFYRKRITDFTPRDTFATRFTRFKTSVNSDVFVGDDNNIVLKDTLSQIRDFFMIGFSSWFYHTQDILKDFALIFDYEKILKYSLNVIYLEHLDELIEGTKEGIIKQKGIIGELEIRLKAVADSPKITFEELKSLTYEWLTASEDYIPQTFRELKINAYKNSILDLEYYQNWLIEERENFINYVREQTLEEPLRKNIGLSETPPKAIDLPLNLLQTLEAEGFIESARKIPLKWLKNKQLLRELMTNEKIRGDYSIAEIRRLTPKMFIDKEGNPLALAKNKVVPSIDSDKISKFLATL
jgi:hypothetical protein